MIVILGCSASGKSTIERKLTEHGWNRIISYTTRPVRTGEVDNIDYHFISKWEFAEKNAAGFFAEDTTYNGWYYGIAKEDCCDDAIAVVETTGFRQLRANKDLHVISFYIQVEERDRVIRMMKRGDNVMESFRRIISDQGTFAGIEREVDWVIANPEGQMESAVVQILERVVRERMGGQSDGTFISR